MYSEMETYSMLHMVICMQFVFGSHGHCEFMHVYIDKLLQNKTLRHHMLDIQF